jgi:hypothetical protein
MSSQLNPCCVCQLHPQKDSYTASCAECEGIWHICFTSTVDGITSAKNAGENTVRAALNFELRNKRRSSLVVALERLLRKKGAKR